MILNFIFFHLNAIVLAIWVFFLIIVANRFFIKSWVKNISLKKLAVIAVVLNITYGAFITWAQYYVWATGSAFSKSFINSPLPKEVPLSSVLEWTRSLFENKLGYFSYYVLGRFWLYIFILFAISFILYFLLKIWKKYRGGFRDDGPLLILILMLISGWPGILVFIPLGFIGSVLYLIISILMGRRVVEIEPVFIFVALIALVYGRLIIGLF